MEEKKERLARLNELVNNYALEANKKMVGNVESVMDGNIDEFIEMYNNGEVVETTLGKGIVMGICTEAQRLRRVNGDSFTNLEVLNLPV